MCRRSSRRNNAVESPGGIRSILRRVLRGIFSPATIRTLQSRIPPNSIAWEFCNVLEPDPQRRVRLNISNKLLEDMHPADLADIVENLPRDDLRIALQLGELLGTVSFLESQTVMSATDRGELLDSTGLPEHVVAGIWKRLNEPGIA